MQYHISITCDDRIHVEKTVYAKTTRRPMRFEALPRKSFNAKALDSLHVRRPKTGA